MAKTDRTAILRVASEPASYNANVDWAIPEKKKKQKQGWWGIEDMEFPEVSKKYVEFPGLKNEVESPRLTRKK